MSAPAVKICGLTRREDAEAAARAGARYLGAVFAPESPRALTPAAAAAIFAGLDAQRVGVFVDASTEEIVHAATVAGLHVLQLHGDEPPEQLRQLRSLGPWALWKAVRVRAPGDLADAIDRYGHLVDGLLVDAWSPHAHGGTGQTFAWDAVAPLRTRVPEGVLFVAAGGLRAENLARAVEVLQPDALDLSSGVEASPGVKDAAAIDTIMLTLASIHR